ncbi:hypothetical protein SAMN05421858_0588 [Haladaptatus litoreus]|uniref:Uncharacterized protein n=1 Tax=Haladaptatus litoreus TaxID=553468 RepID=A0A1N6W3S6_9EURY|nr:hypothetical protein [Haladaptatus litoreus]SIQ84642.1 hypothetical protein SAMN05421858_0588 [Haladaptatus litoreus]
MLNRLNPFSRSNAKKKSQTESDHNIEIRCPETMELLATEETDPDEWDSDVDDGEGIATYDCSHCGGQHRYLWGPPVPLILDEQTADSEPVLFGDE